MNMVSSGNIRAPAAVTKHALLLSPFDFYPAAASRIGGLGGDAEPPQTAYAFHSPYIGFGPGTSRVTVTFAGLAATRGTLVVQINMLARGLATQARVVATRSISVAQLATDGGALFLECEGFDSANYAVLGSVADDTDAIAAGLEIEVIGAPARGLMGGNLTGGLLDVDQSSSLAALYASGPATLEQPVSQMCTANQFDEPVYREWLAMLGEGLHYHRKQWEFIFILQALLTYGALRSGSRGVGFGCGREPMPSVMAALGASVVATDLPADHADTLMWHATGQHGAAIESLRRPHICDDATLERLVTFRAADMTDIPADLQGFDFTWSSCAFEHLGSIEAGLRFVEDSISRLRDGGLAVHTTEFNLTSNDDTLDLASTVLFRRRDIEKLALRLIANGHSVAPIRLDVGSTPLDNHIDIPPYASDPHLKMAFGRYATTSFGIIVRKGGG